MPLTSISKYKISWLCGDVAKRGEIQDLYDADDFALAYCHPLWVELLADATSSQPAFIIAHKEGQLVGALPTTRRKIYGLPVPLCESLSHDCYCFPLLSPKLDQCDRQAVASALLLELVRKSSLARFFPPAWYEFDPAPIAEQAKRKVIHRKDEVIIKNLQNLQGPEDLLASYSKHHRYYVQTSLKSDISFRVVQHVKEFEKFYELIVETMHRSGKNAKFPARTVVEGGRKLIEQGLGTLFIAERAGGILAGSFILWSRQCGIYWLGAASRDRDTARISPAYGVLHLALCDAIRRGVDTFELGSGVTPGLRDFKLKWGAVAVPQPHYTIGGDRMIRLAAFIAEKVKGIRARRAAQGDPRLK